MITYFFNKASQPGYAIFNAFSKQSTGIFVLLNVEWKLRALVLKVIPTKLIDSVLVGCDYQKLKKSIFKPTSDVLYILLELFAYERTILSVNLGRLSFLVSDVNSLDVTFFMRQNLYFLNFTAVGVMVPFITFIWAFTSFLHSRVFDSQGS